MAPAEPFVSLVFYPSTAPAQAGQANALLQMVEATIRSIPGFLGGRMYLSEDGESVVTLVEWQNRDAFVQFRQTDFGRDAIQLAAELHPTAYFLRPYAVVAP